MKKVIFTIGAVAVAAAGYFGLNAAGIIGGPAKLTEQELADGLASYAEEINVDGGVWFDSYSKLTSATVVKKNITIFGRSTINMADLNEGYHDSRIAQATNKICRDFALRHLVRSGARFRYNWLSADGEPIGAMIRFDDGNDDICGNIPIPESS